MSGFRVEVMRFLRFWKWVVIVVWRRCHAFAFGASADSQEQVEDCPHSITSSDGGTASPLDATSSGQGEWKEITSALTAKPSAPRELHISSNIDPAGEFKVPLGVADEASQPTDAAATGPSAQCQISPPRRSLEYSKEHGIIIAQRTPKPAVQDIKIGNETLVMNTRFVALANLKPDQNHQIDQDALHEDRFLEFGIPELDNAAAGGLPVEAKPFKGPGHVPPSVSEGNVSTFAIHVDKTMTNLVPSLEKRRSAAVDRAEVLANLEQTSSTQKSLLLPTGE